MNLSLGIVGLPNVGKSTLFNALTNQRVPAENYPFTTIDPNTGVVAVKDQRLDFLVKVANPEKITPAIVEFVDIAGLIKGAASGEGLGNKFLANIKEVSAIVHVVRAFQNSNITHVENSINPTRDIELINTELILKDIETLEKRLKDLQSRSRSDAKLLKAYERLTQLHIHLSNGKLGNTFEYSNEEIIDKERRDLFLLTDKPVIYLINSIEGDQSDLVKQVISIIGDNPYLVMDVKTEYELSMMSSEDRILFMEDLGMQDTGLNQLTRLAYSALGLISFFTEGPTEVRAWTIQKGFKAPQAAGTIHTDFEKKFITAEICSYEDFVSAGNWNNAKTQGKLRLEGKDYIMRDGDIVIFRHG